MIQIQYTVCLQHRVNISLLIFCIIFVTVRYILYISLDQLNLIDKKRQVVFDNWWGWLTFPHKTRRDSKSLHKSDCQRLEQAGRMSHNSNLTVQNTERLLLTQNREYWHGTPTALWLTLERFGKDQIWKTPCESDNSAVSKSVTLNTTAHCTQHLVGPVGRFAQTGKSTLASRCHFVTSAKQMLWITQAVLIPNNRVHVQWGSSCLSYYVLSCYNYGCA